MEKILYKIMAVIIYIPLWVYYKLGGGATRRDEIAQLLAETRQKLSR